MLLKTYFVWTVGGKKSNLAQEVVWLGGAGIVSDVKGPGFHLHTTQTKGKLVGMKVYGFSKS